MHEAVHAVKAPCVPLVRIPDNLNHFVKRALDSGAQGLIVPMVSTAAQAKSLVSASYFPPKGARGLGSPYAMATYATAGSAPSLKDYLFEANDNILIAVQIETAEGVENVEAIAAVEGVHMLFVGPFDLSNSLGVPLVNGETDKLRTAIDKIKAAAEKAGKYTGIYSVSAEDAARRAREGWNFISLGSETAYLSQVLTDSLRIAKSGETTAKQGVNY